MLSVALVPALKPGEIANFASFNTQAVGPADLFDQAMLNELMARQAAQSPARSPARSPATLSLPGDKLWLRAAPHTPEDALRHLACFQRL